MSHEPKNNSQEPRDYSDKDIKLRPLWMFFIVTVISIGVMFWIFWQVEKDFEGREYERTKDVPDFATERQLPPEDKPRLQAHPMQELAVHRAYEESLINNGVSWTDAGKTKARIPVTNAMEILISQKAFPVREAAQK